LNWAERLAVNNPLRPLQQYIEMKWLRKNAQLKPDAVVLEIGCGRGAGAHLIKKMFTPSVLQAMDLDIRMVQRAYTYLSPEKWEGITFYVGDAGSLPYVDGTMDAIFGFGVLHHVLDWQGALAEIVRVLKIGGSYFFEELYPSFYQNFLTRHVLLHPSENRFRSEDFKQAVDDAGLELGKYLECKKFGIFGLAAKR
jgi:ubiquinone/menaquinone biosynthesis C-methylase UbiE